MGFQFPRGVTIFDPYALASVAALAMTAKTEREARQAIKNRFQQCEEEMVFHRSQKREGYAKQFEAEKNALAKAFPSILLPSRSPSPRNSPTSPESLLPQNLSTSLQRRASLPTTLDGQDARKPFGQARSHTLNTVI